MSQLERYSERPADDRTKLALSHALAQSVKISLFEELISSTIEQTKDIPKSLSETGKIGVRCRLFPSLEPPFLSLCAGVSRVLEDAGTEFTLEQC